METFILHIYLDIQTTSVTPTLTIRDTHDMIKHTPWRNRQSSKQPGVAMQRSRVGQEFELESTHLPGLLRSGHCKETENSIQLILWGGDNTLTARSVLSMVLLILQFPGRSAEYASTHAPLRPAPSPTTLKRISLQPL